jgi:hypothetical protein
MKFLKSQNINKFNIRDQTLFTNGFGLAVMNLSGGLRLPQGTTAQQPNPTEGRWPGITATQTGDEYADGTIRYNITTNSLECLIGGVWEVVRTTGAASVVKRTYGPGDNVSTLFGPLEPAFLSAYSSNVHSIIVLVENVFQIAPGNFDVIQNPDSTGTGLEITTGAFVNGTQYIITSAGDTDFTLIGAAANTVGTVFTATGSGGGTTGKARATGWYIEFTSAVPAFGDLGDPVYVTVYYGYAN